MWTQCLSHSLDWTLGGQGSWVGHCEGRWAGGLDVVWKSGPGGCGGGEVDWTLGGDGAWWTERFPTVLTRRWGRRRSSVDI